MNWAMRELRSYAKRGLKRKICDVTKRTHNAYRASDTDCNVIKKESRRKEEKNEESYWDAQ